MIVVNQIYCAGHFEIYTNIRSLCRAAGTDIKLRVNYASMGKKTFFWEEQDFALCFQINLLE